MNLCDIDTIRDVLRRHGFRFSRSLGQNFLTDASVPQRIAEQSGAAEIKNVVEIGPGMGCLTAELCRRAEKVVAVNADPKAPIFDYADYGIVGHWETVVDKLMEEDLYEL